MPKCTYCKKDYSIPRGLTLIMKDGTINHLCSSKCRKNMALKRRKTRWILKDKKEKTTEIKTTEKTESKKEVEEKAEEKKKE